MKQSVFASPSLDGRGNLTLIIKVRDCSMGVPSGLRRPSADGFLASPTYVWRAMTIFKQLYASQDLD